MFAYLAHLLLSGCEAFFPLVPALTPEAVPDVRGGEWLPDEVYYFTEDHSYRLWQRLRAVVTFDRSNVSFWRKRNRLLGR
jgi:hypothetical protein